MYNSDVMIPMKKEDYPDYLLQCIDKIDNVDETKYWREETELDERWKRVYITLSSLSIECRYFKAWAVMEAYYGFVIEYSDGLFKIGGYETEPLQSHTLLGLIRQLEKRCR